MLYSYGKGVIITIFLSLDCTFCLLKLVQGQGVGDLTSSNIHVSCPTETDDYAEIIDEEDTYTMPSSE